ncbi:hypothetical protein COCNU_07G013940 [Cocos nucifera]|uniref:DUF7645 domain-containing protein n=1 Tax=Cocos nucifera TaxID=13894 RepID=A0A8K0N5G7_COCNU|nr:hypothetical protein COCNU_07G013940 [Cocos nucifera]
MLLAKYFAHWKELFFLRNEPYLCVRVMSAEQRMELLKCVKDVEPGKKISFKDCAKIARELNLTLEQCTIPKRKRKRRKRFSWTDSSDRRAVMRLCNLLAERHGKEWPDIPQTNGTSSNVQEPAAVPGDGTQDYVDKCKNVDIISTTKRSGASSHRFRGKFFKILKSRAFNYLKERNFMIIFIIVPVSFSKILLMFSIILSVSVHVVAGHGIRPFVLSRKFWHDASSSPFPIDSGKRAADFSRELFVSPVLPKEGVGEADEPNNSKSSFPMEHIEEYDDPKVLKRIRVILKRAAFSRAVPHNELPWDAMATYAVQISSVFVGLEMEEISEVTKVQGVQLAEVIVDTLEVFQLVIKNPVKVHGGLLGIL